MGHLGLTSYGPSDHSAFSPVIKSESPGTHYPEEMFAVFLSLCPVERDNDGGGARARSPIAEASCPSLAKWAGWEGLSGGQMRTWPGKGQKASWKPGAVALCPSQTEEQGASPTGLLGTKSLSGMNVLLCKVLACPEADCGVEGP